MGEVAPQCWGKMLHIRFETACFVAPPGGSRSLNFWIMMLARRAPLNMDMTARINSEDTAKSQTTKYDKSDQAILHYTAWRVQLQLKHDAGKYDAELEESLNDHNTAVHPP